MGNQALYRKFRPSKWNEIIGQDLIVRTLQNQINNNMTHAYLFTGTRGTGKTSTAKLFAKTVNCEDRTVLNGKVEPCNKCNSCNEINTGTSLNVIEIDAASNNGVDNIRDIIDEIKYSTSHSKYKIYIIDEVHMLSLGAFNALLKTLEEPPEKVIFILATTDPQKIPITIMSRVQRFDFKRIKEIDIKNTLEKYAKLENIDIDEEAIKYIASCSDGAMRDALSLLDQGRAYYFDETITYEKLLDVLGGTDRIKLLTIIEAMLSFDVQVVLQEVNDIISEGLDVMQVANELLDVLKNLLMTKVAPSLFVGSLSVKDAYILISETFEKEQIMLYIEEFSKFISEAKYSDNKKVLFELLFIKLCNPALCDGNEALVSRVIAIEEQQKNFLKNGYRPLGNEDKIYDVKSGQHHNVVKKEVAQVEPLYINDENIDDEQRDILKFLSENKNKISSSLKKFDEAAMKNSTFIVKNGKITIVAPNEVSAKKLEASKDNVVKVIESVYGNVIDFDIVHLRCGEEISEAKVQKKEVDFKNDIAFQIDEK